MKPRNETKRYVMYMAVVGAGVFFHDMLRYDKCFPMTEEDSSAINNDDPMTPRVVFLERHDADAGMHATVDRWRSRGWYLVDEYGFKPDAGTVKAVRAEARELLHKRRTYATNSAGRTERRPETR